MRDTVIAPTPRAARFDRVAVHILFVAGGLALLVVGSRFFVSSAVALARTAGMSDLVIGLTIVSAGTSLPELVTSLVAARRRHPDIAVGNIVGSIIFNVLGILGIAAVIRPQFLAPGVLAIDVPVMILAALALVPVIRSQGVISRREGLALLACYGGYLVFQLVRG